MTEKEIGEKLDEISKNLRLFDVIVNTDYKTYEGKLTVKQTEIVKKLLKLFEALRFQIAFDQFKEIEYSDDSPILTKNRNCGKPVKVRSCKPEHGDKTYFGILIGDVPLSLSAAMKPGNILKIGRSFYNPAILVPELGEIVYGCESYWGEIKEEDKDNVITDELINNVWYVKAIKEAFDAKD